jgi:hypothetical protein
MKGKNNQAIHSEPGRWDRTRQYLRLLLVKTGGRYETAHLLRPVVRWRIMYHLVLATLFLLGVGCNVDQDKDPIIVPVLEDEFYLDLWQSLSPQGSELVIEFKTLTEEECLNAEVLSNYSRSNRNLTLTLFDILAPETCIPGPAPARGEESLAGLGQGTYNLTVELQEIVSNEGVLSVDESAFRVETPTNGFQWRHGRIERIPASALWGYITYNTQDERQLAEQQLAALSGFSELPDWTEGYYGYFSLDTDGSFVLAERLLPTTDSTTFVPFLLTCEDAVALSDWLNTTIAQLGPAMTLRMYNGVGEEWSY